MRLATNKEGKLRNDPELDRWMSEIRLRAVAQIGKLSRELEKAKNQSALPSGGKSKEEQLAAAGISTSTANRYEELAAPEEQLAPAFESAMENYFATAAVENKEPTFGVSSRKVVVESTLNSRGELLFGRGEFYRSGSLC